MIQELLGRWMRVIQSKSFSFFPSFFLGPVPRGLWDLSPRPGIEPTPPTVEGQSLNHCTTREIPLSFFFWPCGLHIRIIATKLQIACTDIENKIDIQLVSTFGATSSITFFVFNDKHIIKTQYFPSEGKLHVFLNFGEKGGSLDQYSQKLSSECWSEDFNDYMY